MVKEFNPLAEKLLECARMADSDEPNELRDAFLRLLLTALDA